MARAGLTDHPKFRRLVYILKEPIPHVWGYLECLWKAAYQRRSDFIGDAVDVELNAEFPNEPGKLVDALHKTGFIELVGDVFYVHDLRDHAPPYVRRGLKTRANDRREVDQESTSGRPEVDQTDDEPDIESTTGLQGRGKGEGEGKGKGKGKGASATQPPTVAAWLAREWLTHRRGAHTEHDRKAADNFDDLLRAGVTADTIEAEIKRSDRAKTEAIWTMCNRLSPRARSPSAGQRTSGTREFLEQAAKRKAGVT